MDFIDLNAYVRETKGKGSSRTLRRNEKLPAVIYGPGVSPLSLFVNTVELEKTFKGKGIERQVYNLTINNGSVTRKKAMIKEIQKNPVNEELIHVDFYEIDMNRRIKLRIPVKTTGKSIGVENGGLLQIIRKYLEVSCLPNSIPEKIELDITELELGQSIHVEDIKLSEGITIPHKVNFTVLAVLQSKVTTDEEAKAEEGEEGEGEGGEGEVTVAKPKETKDKDKK